MGKGVLSGLRRLVGQKKGETPATPVKEAVEIMERILHVFVDKLSTDGELIAFSEGKQDTMHYILTDIGLSFYTAFHDGVVRGGMGAPPHKPEVTLKMKADLLDGMFTDRTPATRAAMTSKLSFSGDTKKAMSIQRIQKDLLRPYTEAREEVGDPGGLSRLSAEASPAVICVEPQI